MEREIAEHARLEKEVPTMQRKVESLRRELDSLEHQQMRAKQEFEIASAKQMKPKEEELALAYRVLENRRREEPDTGKDEKFLEGAREDNEVEILKLKEAISLYGVDPEIVTEDFWLEKAPENFLQSEVFKKCEAQITTSFEKERKRQMKIVNEELGKFDRTIKQLTDDVLSVFINNSFDKITDVAVKSLIQRICERSVQLHAPPPPPPPAEHRQTRPRSRYSSRPARQ